MNKYAWDVYSPHFVGLDDIFHRLDSMTAHNTNYPPYNLIKHDTSNYEIEIALAGFKKEEIEASITLLKQVDQMLKSKMVSA